MIRRALISVSDKTGIQSLAQKLHQAGVEIISTGGTASALSQNGIPVVKISDLTQFPEMMDGRVKTLHPKIHGGLLALRDNATHMEEANRHGIGMIDLLAVNLYPFEATISKPDVPLHEAIENIDIGGPSMIRSASKNYRSVIVLVDPSDYEPVMKEIMTSGDVAQDTRYRLMIKAFEHTARYDALISSYFASKVTASSETLPEKINLTFKQIQPLRYGENPHQKASFYAANFHSKKYYDQLHGKELSYNNILDLDACVRVVSDFEKPSCVIVKHTNPCGAAMHDDLYQAYQNARATDPVSAFGGVIGFNRRLNAATAEALSEVFVEAIIAPEFDSGAIEILSKKKNIRLIRYDFEAARAQGSALPEIRKALDGYLIQDADMRRAGQTEWKVVTRRAPNAEEMHALLFGWTIVKHVKSNAIVYAAADRTLAIGAGQMSRVDASELAVSKSGKSGLSLKNSAIASDAFFPFRDGVDAAAAAGATAVIQPGGSVKDAEVIAAADEHNMAMVFTSIRHFKH
ncbi:MAG TPA: bifunctional phosphoribosylaminoimidazolecarboxamide formyltransferase/IMP cyclohydrolase [bacterium]|nr:bifunctional phosphoribosylaminoimidazolecarboxamide formyltransferase/IMP cyclohydrolase [bacterium]